MGSHLQFEMKLDLTIVDTHIGKMSVQYALTGGHHVIVVPALPDSMAVLMISNKDRPVPLEANEQMYFLTKALSDWLEHVNI